MAGGFFVHETGTHWTLVDHKSKLNHLLICSGRFNILNFKYNFVYKILSSNSTCIDVVKKQILQTKKKYSKTKVGQPVITIVVCASVSQPPALGDLSTGLKLFFKL